MVTEKKRVSRKMKRIWLAIAAVLVLAGAASGLLLWRQSAGAAAQTTDPGYNTTQVRRGDLTLSASGSGSLVAGQTAELAFPVSGTVAEVQVAIGDMVAEGQALAELADLSTLQAALTAARLELQLAEQALSDLQTDADYNLASARLALAEAEKLSATAQSSIKKEGWARCADDTTEAYYATWQRAEERYNALEGDPNDPDYYLNVLLPAKDQVAQAKATYKYCLGYTAYEIQTSQAEAVVAEVDYQRAQAVVDTLEANGGVDPTTLAQAENAVANAQIAYDRAKLNLEGAVLTAPFAGTVSTLAGETGSQVGTDTFITLIDLLHPRVEFSVDETDMNMIRLGAQAEVVFDALPDQTFTGTVIQISPSLTSTAGYQVLTGVIGLDLGDAPAAQTLLAGLNASVEIISGQAEGVLLAPVEAVRDLGDGQYGVFVLGENGSPRLKVVEVGLMDATYAEIKSGLEQGDTLTTGEVETQ